MRISDWSSDVCSSDLGQHSPSLSWRGLFDLLSDRGKSDHHPPARKCGRKHDCLLAGLFGQLKQFNEAPDDGLVPIEFQPCSGAYSKIGRASVRERGCQYVSLSVGAVSLKTKHQQTKH